MQQPKEALGEITNPVELSGELSKLGAAARRLLESTELDLHYQRRTSSNYETELVQVAASAVAALIDLRAQHGTLILGSLSEEIWCEVLRERDRQDAKFGAMPRSLDPLVWVAVILEELAEVSEEVWG